MKPCKYFNQYKQYILNIANDLIPIRNKRKYSYEYYLTNFNIVLSNGIKWQCLETTATAKNHWKTIYNEFNKWCKHNIFEITWTRFMTNNYHKINNIRKSRHLTPRGKIKTDIKYILKICAIYFYYLIKLYLLKLIKHNYIVIK